LARRQLQQRVAGGRGGPPRLAKSRLTSPPRSAGPARSDGPRPGGVGAGRSAPTGAPLWSSVPREQVVVHIDGIRPRPRRRVPAGPVRLRMLRRVTTAVEPLGKALTEAGTPRPDVSVRVSREIVALLSEQLYSSRLKAIEELVVNCFDADATECRLAVSGWPTASALTCTVRASARARLPPCITHDRDAARLQHCQHHAGP
jgi:hypothetical protein